MGRPENGEERRRNLLGILGGDLSQWWSWLGRKEKTVAVLVSILVLGAAGGLWWGSIQAAYGPLPEQVGNNSRTLQTHELRLDRVDKGLSAVERDVARIDLRQDSIIRSMDARLQRLEAFAADTRCWARVSAGVDDAAECLEMVNGGE